MDLLRLIKSKAICNSAALILVTLTLTGCSNLFGVQEASQATDPRQLYKSGNTALAESDYSKAAEYFEQLEREHPASNLAAEAELLRAYAYYENGQYDDLILTANDFMRQYPAHPHISYVYYLKAIAYYDQIVDIGRDQKLTEQAITALQEVIIRFPHTKYAQDAKLKLDFAINSLAGKEMEIGRFYLHSYQLIAAMNRFKKVVDDYQTSMFVPEALYRLSELHHYMGVEEEAQRYAAVLGHNYPDSEWYKKAYDLLHSKVKDSGWSYYPKLKSIIKKVW